MRKILILMFTIITIVSTGASLLVADDQSGRVGIGAFVGPLWLWQGGGRVLITEPAQNNAISTAGLVLGGNLRVGIAPEFAIMFSSGWGYSTYQLSKVDTSGKILPGNTVDMQSKVLPIDINAIINLAPEFKFNPYLIFGGGLTFWQRFKNSSLDNSKANQPVEEMKGSVKFGAGFEVFMSERISLDIAGRYQYVFTEFDMFNAPSVTNTKDTDKNLILDDIDQDADVNGVLDVHIGIVFYLGGERDTDGDGIFNKKDKCPSDPEDFDSFEDDDGCPDLDNDMDGINDANDRCPNKPEDIDSYEDHDGCPDLDNDNDGIADKLDKCPNEAEDKDSFEDEDGCPDLDNDQDNVLDLNDKCPNEPEDIDGFEDYDGCPEFDNDKDGVPDPKDKCNNTPSGVQVDSVGCPIEIVKDQDEDGILDENDKCPTLKEDMDGFEDMNGCPDLDNDQDGLLDTDDSCPNDAEDVDNFKDKDGCPDLDNDQDGVLDKEDKCPGSDDTFTNKENTKETRNDYKDEDGCPDEKPQEIKKDAPMILRGVKFRTGSTDLTDEAYPILDKVYESLDAYPEVKVEIRGYTDNTGGYEMNLSLSQRRAESVKRYLELRGVDPGRLTAKGLGPADPVASNRTARGRAQNRRIEFHRID